MDAIRIEILNPKAARLIEGMEDLKLIRIDKNYGSRLKTYLEKMRRNSATAPDANEIAAIVKETRAERNEKK